MTNKPNPWDDAWKTLYPNLVYVEITVYDENNVKRWSEVKAIDCMEAVCLAAEGKATILTNEELIKLFNPKNITVSLSFVKDKVTGELGLGGQDAQV
jgi:hypothetical protein